MVTGYQGDKIFRWYDSAATNLSNLQSASRDVGVKGTAAYAGRGARFADAIGQLRGVDGTIGWCSDGTIRFFGLHWMSPLVVERLSSYCPKMRKASAIASQKTDTGFRTHFLG